MKKGILIAGFSGIGKTVLGKKYKNVIDLDSAEYVYDDSDMLHIPFEKRKGKVRKSNAGWPQNYIRAINKAIKEYDIVLVWDREDIVKEYIKNKIDFILCYPVKEDLDKYKKRFKDRGNTKKYIEIKTSQYNDRMKLFEKLDVKRIILSDNETLEEYLIKNNYKLLKK